MKVRWDPQQQRFPALAGKLVVDTFRGKIRVRKWPKKRGPSKSQAVRDQNEWFAGANRLAKHVDAGQQNLAIAMTLGTGLYPRDLLLRQMAGGMYEVITAEGREIKPGRYFRETVVFQGAIVALAAHQTLITNVFTLISWPLPTIDTAGFWDVAAPTRFTIPAGINVVKIDGGWNGVLSTPNRRQIVGIFKNGAFFRLQDGFAVSTPAQTIGSAAISVVAGDFFELKCRCAIFQQAFGPVRTFMSVTVLDAD